jgi:hypothetical protein
MCSSTDTHSALSFHKTAYQERLNAVTTAIKVIDHLRDYKPKRKTHPAGQSSSFFRMERDPMLVEEGLTASDGPKGKGKSRGSRGWFKSSTKERKTTQSRSRSTSPVTSTNRHSYPPRRATPDKDKDGAEELLAQAARTVKRAVMHDARNMRGANSGGTGGIGGAGDEDETGLKFKMGSAKEAKVGYSHCLSFIALTRLVQKIARDIYHNLKQDRRRNYLIPSDFFPAYPTPDEARAAFKVFDKDGNDDITRAEIKTMVVKVYRERRFLSRSMKYVS